jgi:hypothetical protein
LGYELHITRKQGWSDEDGPIITQAEWEAYIASDPELRLDGYAEVTMPTGSKLRVTPPGIAVWTAHPDPSSGPAWITLGSSGNVRARNPDRALIRKMCQIAQQLGARVMGDDGEIYGGDGQPDPDGRPVRPH